ncbi:MAG: 2-succinyl-5-enolpyruvyl-6-hydroxy-3-cyclohexene-1-carboxylic-acid synthase [Flavobacteriales bacterium]|nr:2-succinyl-5-enolpyruvyl-6-hydroxy-3-cyclohexene-1-carboxylic-acid synthase [Flavobacteriales bacterium]
MGKLSDKPAIADLVAICAARGLKRVIISPGSRNAPLSISFLGHGGFDVQVIGDERSAGFIALGMSQSDHKPTILVCTSGSALLNYLPAVSEAYYQRIPLLILSADRPEEWVDQMEGQTMRQRGSMSNFVNREFHLPQEAGSADRQWYSARLVNDAITATHWPKCGPVHVNIPLKEPLYGQIEASPEPKIIHPSISTPGLPSNYDKLKGEVSEAQKVMVILGLDKTQSVSADTLARLAKKGVVILNETSSNSASPQALSWIDRTIAAIPESERQAFVPDLLITAGGPLVSKRIKTWLRNEKIAAHWHVDEVEAEKDLFQSLTCSIYCAEGPLLEAFASDLPESDPTYLHRWEELHKKVLHSHDDFLSQAPFSDLKAYQTILEMIPSDSIVQMANSAAVRYVQLFPNRPDITYYGNRGVSGIEGCTSTAMGLSTQVERPVFLLSGDMAFRYDGNAFWNDLRPKNLKCIVINNHGGGIFRIIPGPDSTDHLDRAFEAHQENSAEKMARMYDLEYRVVSDEPELKSGMDWLIASQGPAILEVFTPREKNADILREYFEFLGQ